MKLEQRLAELYIDLPEKLFQTAGPVSACVCQGKLLHVLGALPFADARLSAKGVVPSETRLDLAAQAAKQCFTQVLASARQELGSVNELKRVVSYELLIQTAAGFADHAKVADPLSELIKELFGKDGKHARSVLGVVSLPQNASVALNVVFETR